MHRQPSRTARSLAVITGLLAVAASAAATASTLWDFRIGGSTSTVVGSGWGNVRTFSMGTETVRVTAWADDGPTPPTPAFRNAYSGQYTTGLGICNRSEAVVAGSLTNCATDGGVRDQVDNVGQNDFMLLEFSSLQALEEIVIDPRGVFDRDVSFWVGTVTGPLNLTGLGFADLAGLGFGPQVDLYNGTGEGPLAISLGNVTGNAILFGALYPPNGDADKFKIQSITSTSVVPVPGALWLFGSAAAMLGALRRRAPAAA